jgi:hypothetical protein
MRPVTPELPAFYQRYIDLVPEPDIFSALENQQKELKIFLGSIHTSKADYAYAPDKWTVAQVLQHCIDAERIFAYRALRIARGDKTPLPGWEENDYAAMAPVRTLLDLTEEIMAVRRSNSLLLMSFSEEAWGRTGTANNRPMDVLSLAYLIVGHMRHHIKILQERYGL